MTACPACSQPISPNDLACPNCGISLNPGTATAGPAAGGAGRALSVAAIVVMGFVGIVLLIVCLGSVGWLLLPGIGGPLKPATRGFPAGSTTSYEFDAEIESVSDELPTTEEPAETPDSRP